jgi:hypothetical protein
LEDVEGMIVMNCPPEVLIWKWFRESTAGTTRKDSSGEIASLSAERIPYLSAERYLPECQNAIRNANTE